MQLDTATLLKLTLHPMQTKLTFSQEGSPASPTPQQASEEARKMTVTSGRKCLEQLEKLPRATSWEKTYLALLIGTGDWYSMRCVLTWRLKATKSRPWLYLRRRSMPRTEGIGCSLLLKTPCTADAYSENLTKKEQIFGNSGTLAQEIQSGFVEQRWPGLLPTPTAMDSTNATAEMKSTQVKDGSMHSVTLSRLLLTPSASDGMRSGMTMDSLKKHNKKNAENSNLAEQIAHKVGGGTSHLNPRFVAEMMGFPVNWTELPFQSGEANQ